MAKKRSVTPNGDAVRAARLRKAWSTDDLAGHALCTTKTIENAERGKAIYANTLARIASALGVAYDSLIARPVEKKTPTKLDTIISTTRVDATFGIVAREDQPIDTDWFLGQLRSHVDFLDPVDVVSNRYQRTPGIPEGGVLITLKMTTRDYRQVWACFAAKSKSNPDELFLKVVFVGADFIPNPYIRNEYLWVPPVLWHKPPHTHLYD
jgi:transcriptional regulator with XRE-family HTH domain